MQYISKDLDLGSSWDYGFNYNSGGNSSSGSSNSSGGNGGGNSNSKAIQERELIALAQADIYLLNPIINKTNRAVSIGRYRVLVDQYTAIVITIAAITAKKTFS